MKKGIASVNGNSLPKVGETNFYEVGSFYPGTQVPSNNADIKWKLFVEQSGGKWRELRGPQKTGRRVPFNFPQQWYGKKLLIEAYLNSAEMKAPPGIIVMPVTGKRKIDGIGFFDSNWNPLSQTPKYGQTLNIRINTISMLGETLRVSLWERDTFSDTGHDPTENTNIWGSERTFKVQNPNGRVEFPLRLDPAWAILADKGMWDVEGSEHEFYLLVKGAGAQTKYSVQRSVKNEEIASQPSSNTNSQNNPTPTPNAPQPGANPSQPAGTTPQNSSSPLPTNAPTPTPTEQQEPIKVGGIGANPPVKNNGNSTSTVDLVITEGVTDAYFAKKEFSRLTGEEDGEHTYTFGGTKANNKTSTSVEKEKVANAILNNGKVNDTLKPNKKYTTKEAIVAALTANEYGKDSADNKTVKFKTFKLGEEFKKIFSAPLEDKVYLVAKTYFLEGKTATITVNEKDGLIKGAADAVLPLSEISEAKMVSTEALTEADRTEKTSFSGTIAKIETGKNDKGQAIISEMYIVPVQLRPKTDADLTAWKEKTTKGKKDADYTYTFGGTNNITTENGKKSVAAAILKNIKAGNAKNTKLADGIVAYEDDIIAALQVKTYLVDNTVTFSTYKKVIEMLWLNVKASGEKDYNKDFLKSEGSYFQIAPPKLLIFPTREKPINDSGLEWEERYWAETQKDNVVCFGAARTGRKHAARDLYTNPNAPVIAVAAGKVIGKNKYFGANDVYVSVLHKLSDGRKFIVKYCELAKSSVSLKIYDEVIQGQELGKTAHLGVSAYNRKVKKTYSLYMCHFEVYDCSAGEENPTYINNPPYMRRRDLIDPLPVLREAYINTFGGLGKGDDHLFTVEDGKVAIRELYNRYKNSTWNWKWEGSEKDVKVTGKDLLNIVEKMYRLETAHFTSKQYQNCGTGGMEVFGIAPYYGWDGSLFTEEPIGTWSAFEGAGLSGAGGNAQVTSRKKEFVKLSSVEIGMEYKIKYIIKYNGNYARWFNKDSSSAQTTYRASLVGIKAKFIQEITAD